MPSVLIVDDLPTIHEMMETVIQSMGYTTAVATDGETALRRYKESKYDLVLTDIDMKPMDGIALLGRLKAHDPGVIVIMMTAYTTTERAVQALKLGAYDYLEKPFQINELTAALRRGMEFRKSQLEQAQSVHKPRWNAADVGSRLIGQSPAIKKLLSHLKKLTPGRTPVLLTGDTGTGKTLVAKILHDANGGTDENFVDVDCQGTTEAGLREGLIGSNGEGGKWVKQAKDGTLLLQHLDCLAESLQRELVPVLRGSAHGFRPVCTTRADLEPRVEEGKFHDELFYRVAALPMQLPPLRERTGDVPLLVKYFTTHAVNPGFDANQIEWADDAIAVLSAYHWPGNVAELHQVVSKLAATTATRVITSQQLPLRLREVGQWPTLAERFADQQKEYIQLVLRACHGDKVAAAKALGVEPGKLN